jgi:hypothetical protein
MAVVLVPTALTPADRERFSVTWVVAFNPVDRGNPLGFPLCLPVAMLSLLPSFPA